MRFNDIPYKRIDISEYQNKQNDLIKKISENTNLTSIKKLIKEYEDNYIKVITLASLAMIRYTINTNDKFYDKENNYLNEINPLIEEVTNNFNKTLLNHTLKNELENIYGSFYFLKLNIKNKIFDQKIIDLLILESKLQDEYDKLIAGAEIEFDGKINNLSQMAKYSQNLDREIRKNAAIKVDNFMAKNDEKIINIYLELVKVRDKIAKTLGFNNYNELGYLRLGRTDYDINKVNEFRKNILEYVVPIANKLIEKQTKRINIANPKHYDLSLNFLDGNPTPKGDTSELVQKAKEMYHLLSKETDEFFNFMIDNDLMDLETKPGKMSGGYCSDLPLYKAPFIFANFNKTADDVNVLTHEAGHAFQYYYASKFINNPDMICPTYETAEIHSTAMEFFSYPYLESFFKEDTNKYKQIHMSEMITFLPYSCLVDHFQSLVYENPTMNATEIKNTWQKLEKIYLPWKDYGECKFTASGTFWYKQSHIFIDPLYYIDYALASICALEFYLLDLEDHNKAWHNYLKLCSLGGTLPFLELLKAAGLNNPFEKETIHAVINNLIPIIEKM